MLCVNPNIDWRWENSEFIIFQSGLILNRTGGEILELARNPISIDQILSTMMQKYADVDKDVISNDIKNYIQSLLKFNILLDSSSHNNDIPVPNSSPKYLENIKKTFNNRLKAPFGIACEITHACNLNCKHCCVSAGNDRKGDELNTTQWKQIIEQMSEMDVFTCTITGGEPMLRKDVYELISYAKKKNLNTSLLTNGGSLNEKKISFFAESGLDSIAISIDGIGKVHDEFRGVKGLYDKILGVIPLILKQKLPLGIVTVINSLNIDHIRKLIETLDGIGVTNISLAYYRLSGRGAENSFLAPAKNDYIKFLRSVFDYDEKQQHDIKIKYPNIPITFYKEAIGEEEYTKLFKMGKIGLCGAGIVGAVIDPQGYLKPCDMSGESKCGNVLTTSVKDVWLNSKMLEELRDLDCFNLYPCNSCENNINRTCLTGCRAMPYQFDKDGNHLRKADYIRENCYKCMHPQKLGLVSESVAQC